jgi:hypothetical protein
MNIWPSKKDFMPQSVTVSGRVMALRLRSNTRAKRLVMRIDPKDNALVISAPRRTPSRRVMQFVEANHSWIAKHIARLPQPIKLEPGAIIPLRGKDYKTVPTGKIRGHIKVQDEVLPHNMPSLAVPGAPSAFARRITDFLKKEARKDLEQAVSHYTAKLGKTAAHIKIKDTRSRWGSCSSSGVLSFSWRIIMAPPFALNYLVVHEVAHLQEMNHSKAFWSLVAELEPDWEQGKNWLKTHGPSLHAVKL